jgi:phytoene dehydrogenase-like protein
MIAPLTPSSLPTPVDVVIIGSGLGGLCCAATLAYYGLDVLVCESHTLPGGAAHSFSYQGFHFDSGPSLFSGLSYPSGLDQRSLLTDPRIQSLSVNPLRQVLDLIEEDVSWLTYDAWGCFVPEGYFRAAVGAEPFLEILRSWRGEAAVAEWQSLQQIMDPLKRASVAIPPLAVRWDWGAWLTLGRFLPDIWQQGSRILQLSRPFSDLLSGVIQDPFIRNWLDLLCFMLSGLPAEGTIAAEMAFMFADWYRPGVKLDYPAGGTGSLVKALIRGITKKGGRVQLKAPVKWIQVKKQGWSQWATGVELENGQKIEARLGVVSNASLWDTLKLLPMGSIPPELQKRQSTIPTCRSFMHLHLGIDATALPSDLECHYLVVDDWERGVDAEQNVVAISIPSVLDPTLAPPGKQGIHAYLPATEPYALWQGLDRSSETYQHLKRERSEVLWRGLERIIPDIRQRCELTLVGTPLTHERFLRRYHGTYGPAIPAGRGLFPGSKTPIDRLLCCGDSTFPGIGVPAVAASGLIAAHQFIPVGSHFQLLGRIRG